MYISRIDNKFTNISRRRDKLIFKINPQRAAPTYPLILRMPIYTTFNIQNFTSPVSAEEQKKKFISAFSTFRTCIQYRVSEKKKRKSSSSHLEGKKNHLRRPKPKEDRSLLLSSRVGPHTTYRLFRHPRGIFVSNGKSTASQPKKPACPNVARPNATAREAHGQKKSVDSKIPTSMLMSSFTRSNGRIRDTGTFHILSSRARLCFSSRRSFFSWKNRSALAAVCGFSCRWKPHYRSDEECVDFFPRNFWILDR